MSLKSIVLYFSSSSMHVCYKIDHTSCQYLVCLKSISFYFQPNMSNDCISYYNTDIRTTFPECSMPYRRSEGFYVLLYVHFIIDLNNVTGNQD